MAVLTDALTVAGLPMDRLEVASFDGLTVDFCRTRGASAIVRGLRAISDFETEMQLAHNNRILAPGIDTVFFMTSIDSGYVSSSLVKEIASFGGDVSGMVPPAAASALREALERGRRLASVGQRPCHNRGQPTRATGPRPHRG